MKMRKLEIKKNSKNSFWKMKWSMWKLSNNKL